MFIFHGYLGDFIFDCGRESYFPLEVLNGKVLYKDIFDNYGPFSYQMNAFLYSFFGIKLGTLYMSGAFNAIIILVSTYFITRTFTTKTVSYLVTLFIMFSCVFKSCSLFNFIFPYSYAMLYALSTFMLSVLFLILYLRTSRQLFVPLSWLFIGISITSKQEYLLYVIVLAIMTFFIRPVDKKHTFYSFFGFLITPLISFSTLFLQGLTFADLANITNIVKKLSFSPSIHHYYEIYTGLYPNKTRLVYNGLNFLDFLSYFMPFLLSFYCLLTSMRRKWKKHFLLLLYPLLGGSIFYCCDFLVRRSNDAFSFLPILTSVIFTGLVIVQIKKIILISKTKKINEIKEICQKYIGSVEGIYLITVFIALTSCIKGFFYLNLLSYGTFFLPLIFITTVVFLVEYIPQILKFLDKELWRNSVCVVLAVISFSYLGISLFLLKAYYKYPVEAGGEKIYIQNRDTAESSIAVVDYIEHHMNPSDTFLVLPEGLMFNFLTRHRSNDIYFSALMPPNIEAFGEGNIIKGLKNDPPDYIFIHNYYLFMFKTPATCENSGLEVCGWIYDNYSKIKVFGTSFKMTLYKNIK